MQYIEDKDIDDSIDLIIGTYNSFWEDRSFYKYTLETTIYAMFGDGKKKIDGYVDFAKKTHKKEKTIDTKELNRKRKEAEEFEKELKQGGGWKYE